MEPANFPKSTSGIRFCDYRIVEAEGERADGSRAPSRYALSTDRYCPDGWVLLPSGFRSISKMPILHQHGRSDKSNLPLGDWIDCVPVGRELLATPKWKDGLNEAEREIKSCADQALFKTSIRYDVIPGKWHEPSMAERVLYGIPSGESFVRVADEWYGLEGSFVAVPMDLNAGPRELAIAYARAAGIDLAPPVELEGFRAEIKNLLDKGFSNVNASLAQLAATLTQRGAAGNDGSAVVPAAPTSSQPGTHNGRSLYDLEQLGTPSAIEILAKIRGQLRAPSTVNNNAETDKRDGAAGG